MNFNCTNILTKILHATIHVIKIASMQIVWSKLCKRRHANETNGFVQEMNNMSCMVFFTVWGEKDVNTNEYITIWHTVTQNNRAPDNMRIKNAEIFISWPNPMEWPLVRIV